MQSQGGVLPPDSKYHPKGLSPREPLPTVNLESLKSRALWDSHLAEEWDAGAEEAKTEGAEGADVTVEASTSHGADQSHASDIKTSTWTS